MMGRSITIDSSLQKVGDLTFVDVVARDRWGHRVALIRCDCGREFTMRVTDYSRGHYKSCGHVPHGRKNNVRNRPIASKDGDDAL